MKLDTLLEQLRQERAGYGNIEVQINLEGLGVGMPFEVYPVVAEAEDGTRQLVIEIKAVPV